jgi:CheY-like chemotaxis protein/signal transduction histidine kinase
MKLRKINIGTRLILGFGLIVAFAVVVGVFALNNISKATIATENIYNHPLKVSNAVRDIKTNVIAIHRSLKDVALAENEIEMLQAELLINGYEKNVHEAFEIVFNQFLGNIKDIETAYNSFAEWKPIREDVIHLWQSGENAEAIKLTKGKGADYVEKVLSDVDVMIEFASNKADEFYAETKKNEREAFNYMRGLLVVVLLVSILIIILISRSLIIPLKALIINARKIETGNLKARNVIRYDDEISKLAISFNSMAESIDSREKILKGLSDISSEMIGKEELVDFAESLVSKFMKFTKSQMVVFYALNKTTNSYEPIQSIGANTTLLKSFNAKNLEGEFGNIISTKEIFYLKKISKSTIFTYKSTIGDIVPREVISIPIVVNDEVAAIITCANIRPFSLESIDVIFQAQSLLNASYATLIANQETKQFAEKLESINQELEMQSEELQEQTEELQQQSNELKLSSDQLYEQNVELEMQRIQVEEANRLKSEFLSNMSHELRTPLNSINALSKVLIMQASNKLEEDESNYLKIIERNGKRLLSLINNILDLSKVEAGKMEIHTNVFSLNSALALMTENVQSLADDKGVSLNLDISEKIEIESDESRLHQVVTNVLGNAIKFTEEGKVDVTLEKDEKNAIIKISDTGIGIEKDVLPFIFNEFRQADGTTSRSYEGTGLGLAIAKKIVTALHGSIAVESEKGVGSTFIIEVPLFWHGAATIANNENANVNSKTDCRKTILVVDDDKEITKNISLKLEEEGYSTIRAYSGKEALELAEKHKPYAITLDVVMPDIDGWEVLQTLKSNHLTSKIPVIIISKTNDAETSMALGAVGYIGKPIDKKILIEEIKKVNAKAKKLVIVDDSEVDRMQVLQILQQENFENMEFKSGEECLEYLKTETPDLLILDLMMPGMDGFQVLKEIRRNENTRDLPVIIVTAKDLSDNDKEFLNGRAASVLQKGDSSNAQMVNEIHRLLQNLEKPVTELKYADEKTGKNILMIEDNESAIIQVQKVLEKEGLVVNSAQSGKEAIEIVKSTIPDGIILDLMMPEMDGFEVLEKIRSSEETRNIPVLILTAKNLTKKDLSQLSSNNIQQLIQKGDADIDELISKVNKMLGIKKEKIEPEKKPLEIPTQKPIEIVENSDGLPKILLIEDNPDNRITARAILGNKYFIVEAEDGLIGLQKVFEDKPDLILLDISLPGKDGIQVVKEIRENEETRDIPVIALTAKAMKDDRENLIEAGCDEYVSKPIDDVELLEKISRFL